MDCEDNYTDIQRDFYHSQDTKIVLREADKMRFGLPPFSAYTAGTGIA